jgi:hypothetical protein
MATFYSALKDELERIERADVAARSVVDEGNWRSRLDELRGQLGNWDAVAAELGTNRRQVERWRLGYVDRRRHGGERRFVSPSVFLPRIREAVARQLPELGDRRRQVTLVDWRKLVITGTIRWKPDYERTETMYIGRYFEPAAMSALAQVYIDRSPQRMGRAIDHALSNEYLGFDVHLTDVEELHF